MISLAASSLLNNIDQELREERVLFIEGDINSYMPDFRREMIVLMMDSTRKPIWIFITSPGGSAVGALTILDTIRLAQSRGVQVNGVVIGDASSAALIVLQGCDERYAGPYSSLMAHGVSGMYRGDKKSQVAINDWTDSLQDRFAELFAQRTNHSAQEWIEMFQDDTPHFYTAQEALDEGLIDHII